MERKLIAITFPEGTKLEHIVVCLNETEIEHLLLQIIYDYPKEGCLTVVFRGNRAGDADYVKEKVHDWLRSMSGLQRHVATT